MWSRSGATPSDTVRVTLRERGKYRAVQEALSSDCSNERNDFPSDAVFANFRSLSGGRLRRDFIWRGASAIDTRFNRAGTADRLLRENNIGFVLDLSDTKERAEGFAGYAGSRFAELAAEGKVVYLALNVSFMSEQYGTNLINGFRLMMAQDAPVYIQCTKGEDRTGFVCILLEALAGANYGELVKDYMESFRNYYRLTEESDPDKYRATVYVKFLDIISQLTGKPDDTDYTGYSFTGDARKYLLRWGMTQEEVERLTRYLTEE